VTAIEGRAGLGVECVVLVRGIDVGVVKAVRVGTRGCDEDVATAGELAAVDFVRDGDGFADVLTADGAALDVLMPAIPSGADGEVSAGNAEAAPWVALLPHAVPSRPTSSTATAAERRRPSLVPT
jgi:hypothetical protein